MPRSAVSVARRTTRSIRPTSPIWLAQASRSRAFSHRIRISWPHLMPSAKCSTLIPKPRSTRKPGLRRFSAMSFQVRFMPRRAMAASMTIISEHANSRPAGLKAISFMMAVTTSLIQAPAFISKAMFNRSTNSSGAILRPVSPRKAVPITVLAQQTA